jgi:prevent-host-death family protein
MDGWGERCSLWEVISIRSKIQTKICIFLHTLEAEMNQIIGVTELQRRFRAVFEDVTKNHVPYVLTRGSKPQAVLIPYDEYMRYQAQKKETEDQRYERLMKRMQELNAHFSDEEVAADVEAAIQEVRAERRARKAAGNIKA